MSAVTVASALQLVAELVPLIQSAVESGASTVDVKSDLAAAISARDAALNQLDLDIAKSSG